MTPEEQIQIMESPIVKALFPLQGESVLTVLRELEAQRKSSPCVSSVNGEMILDRYNEICNLVGEENISTICSHAYTSKEGGEEVNNNGDTQDPFDILRDWYWQKRGGFTVPSIFGCSESSECVHGEKIVVKEQFPKNDYIDSRIINSTKRVPSEDSKSRQPKTSHCGKEMTQTMNNTKVSSAEELIPLEKIVTKKKRSATRKDGGPVRYEKRSSTNDGKTLAGGPNGVNEMLSTSTKASVSETGSNINVESIKPSIVSDGVDEICDISNNMNPVEGSDFFTDLFESFE